MAVDFAENDARQRFIAKRADAYPDFRRVVRGVLQLDRDVGIAGIARLDIALQGILDLAGHRELQILHRRLRGIPGLIHRGRLGGLDFAIHPRITRRSGAGRRPHDKQETSIRQRQKRRHHQRRHQ